MLAENLANLSVLLQVRAMEKDDASTDWQRIEAQLPRGWRELGDEMGLLQERPAHMGTKVRDLGVALRLVLHQAGTSASLRATTALAAATGVVTLSAVSLHQWMKKIGPYLTVLLARMVESAAFSPEKWGGLHIIVGDATTVQRPASKGTTARVHYALRLADMTPRHIEVTDEHGGETARRFRAEPGEVWLLDRAYANPAGVASIHDRGAHIIVRYNRGTLPVYDKQGNRIDVIALLQETQRREDERQKRAVVLVDGERISGRLCWVRLPVGKAEQARRRAAKESDASATTTAPLAAEVRDRLSPTILTELTAKQVLELYRARWQVELEFKRAKSIRELDQSPQLSLRKRSTAGLRRCSLQLISVRIANASGPRSDAFPPVATTSPSSQRCRRLNRRDRGADRRRTLVRGLS